MRISICFRTFLDKRNVTACEGFDYCAAFVKKQIVINEKINE